MMFVGASVLMLLRCRRIPKKKEVLSLEFCSFATPTTLHTPHSTLHTPLQHFNDTTFTPISYLD